MTIKTGAVCLALVLVMTLLVACGAAGANEPVAAISSGSARWTGLATTSNSNPASLKVSTSSTEAAGLAAPASPADPSVTYARAPSSRMGISVNGEGSITLPPDLAVLNIGVETQGGTVSAARREAATAMDAIIAAAKEHGLADEDIQTTSFNIWPNYIYSEGAQELIGYRVSNSVTIKVRDLDGIGEIIDSLADAGGNATRIHGISFTVEDQSPFVSQLREAAVRNAMDKAQHYAELTGVELDGLIYLTETGGVSAPTRVTEAAALSAGGFDSSTPISRGELSLRLTVPAVFAID